MLKKELVLLVILMQCSLVLVGQSSMYTKEEVQKEAVFVEGVKQQILGHHDKAIDIFEKMWQDDKSNENIAFELSRSYEATNQYGKAIEYAEKAIALFNENPFFHMQLAESYEADQKIFKAGETYEGYTQIDPTDRFFYEKAVYFYLQDGNYNQAIEVLNQLENQFGMDELITKQKVEIYDKTDRKQEAIEEMQKLANRFPEKIVYQLNLANYYLELKDVKGAKKVYTKVLEIDPKNETAMTFFEMEKNADNPDLQYLYAIGSDMKSQSVPLDDKIMKLLPVLQNIAKNQDSTSAKVVADLGNELVKTHPNEAKAYAILGDAYMLSNQFSKAIEAYESTIQLQSGVFDVWAQLMESQYILGRFKDLSSTVEDALLRFPNQALVFLYGAKANNYLGKSSYAKELAAEGVFIASGDSYLANELKIQLAMSEMLSGSDEKAIELIESKAESDWSPEMIVLQVKYYLENDNQEKANEIANKGRKMYPYHRNMKDLTSTQG